MFPGFEIDCGEVLEGHRLLATGLRVDGMSDDDDHADYSEHSPGKPVYPIFWKPCCDRGNSSGAATPP